MSKPSQDTQVENFLSSFWESVPKIPKDYHFVYCDTQIGCSNISERPSCFLGIFGNPQWKNFCSDLQGHCLVAGGILPAAKWSEVGESARKFLSQVGTGFVIIFEFLSTFRLVTTFR